MEYFRIPKLKLISNDKMLYYLHLHNAFILCIEKPKYTERERERERETERSSRDKRIRTRKTRRFKPFQTDKKFDAR